MQQQARRAHRAGLIALAVFGLVFINGAFLYGVLSSPNPMAEAMRNPISAAFIVEAFVLVVVFAFLLPHWRVTRLHWAWFIALSLLGSIAFAPPIALLFPPRAEARAAMGPA